MPEGDAVISLDHAFDAASLDAALESGAWPQLSQDPAHEAVRGFLRQIREDATVADMAGLDLSDLMRLAADFWAFAAVRSRRSTQVRIRGGDGRDGRALDRDILEIVGPDRAFLVDSVMGEIAGQGLDVLAMLHPVVSVARDAEGRRAGPGGPGGTIQSESMIQVHLRPLSAAQQERLGQGVGATLREVAQAVEDWRPMLAEMDAAIDELEAAKTPDAAERDEALAFLRWLRDDHFAFLGSRAYTIPGAHDGPCVAAPENATGLGLLRDPARAVLRADSEPVLTEDFAQEKTPVLVAKSNMRSRVHRRTVADYVSVKRYSPGGAVVGERRFVGLFTAEAYNRQLRDVPLIRRKAQHVRDAAARLPGGHSDKILRDILENYPRDELFQSSQDELLKIALGLLHLEDRPRPRLFLRRDRFDRFVSALVYLPRDRYSATLRAEIGEMLRAAFDGRMSAFYPFFTDGPLARVQFIIGLAPGRRADPDPAMLEREIARMARSWEEALEEHLRLSGADDALRAAALRYGPGFGAGYRENFTIADAATDLTLMQGLDASPDIACMARPDRDDARIMRFKIYHADAPLPLSHVMPILETMGLEVVWEQGHRIACDPHADGAEDADARRCVWIHDFETRLPHGADARDDALRARFESAFDAVWRGRSEADPLNALILSAGADWRDAAFLRTLARWRRQAVPETSQAVMAEALRENPAIARLLLDLRDARFDPASGLDMDARRARADEIAAQIARALDAVENLDLDRALRGLLATLRAVTRTGFFQTGPDGAPHDHIAIKIASAQIADLPEPKPFREIFVWSPEAEGVHLRFGAVARGGLRWSDRRDDFRTEALSLVKTQQVKNAVIVPAGAKGGFYPKRLPKDGGRDAVQAAAIDAYRIFIRAMLELTDNLDDAGGVVPPADMVRWDEDDPYLVVAADKGTASFSDIANDVAMEAGFWLGDAFASGGSAGYDHKAMGITARGAWEAVKRHFRELGKDIQAEPFTVIGVGDMSGDVFGNGMLLSKQIRLLAAFDHRDIFIDPEPDPETGWAERKRLFDTPRSSWADYDRSLIAPGGGVFSRSEKSIPLSPQMRALTGLDADSATPATLIRALLGAPCDLLWFGGVGTYVKAADEQDRDVGDKTNDALRVNGADLRAVVVGEGANLGVTQRGRIEFARKGGRIDTDAVDNSGGVDASDHEVNIKILLNGALASGRLAPADRNPLLAAMTDEVARLVLATNTAQTLALSLAEATAARDLDAHERLMTQLEAEGRLNRTVERLPDASAVQSLREAGLGLTRPEIAILLAYAKIALSDDLVAGGAPDDPAFSGLLRDYFPAQLAGYEAEMQGHRLRREIVATRLANDIVNLGGPAFVLRMREMTGADSGAVAHAFAAAQRIFGLDALADRIDAPDDSVPAAAQMLLHRATLDFLRGQTRRLIRRAGGAAPDIAHTVARYRNGAVALAAAAPALLFPAREERIAARAAELVAAGAPEALAQQVAGLAALEDVTDIVDLAEAAGWPAAAVARLLNGIGGRLGVEPVRVAAAGSDAPQHWSRLAARRMGEALADTQLRLTRAAIDGAARAGDPPPPDGDAGADWAGRTLDRFADHNRNAMNRAETTLGELALGGGWTLARIALADTALRELADGAGA